MGEDGWDGKGFVGGRSGSVIGCLPGISGLM